MQELLHCAHSGQGMQFTTHLHLVLRSKVSGAIPPFPLPAFKVTKIVGVILRVGPVCLAAFYTDGSNAVN